MADARQMVKDMIAALNAGELEQAYEAVAEDCVHISPLGMVEGREALKASEIPLLRAMSSQWRRIERLLVSGNDVAFWLTFGGTVQATDKSFETEVCNVLTFDGDRIVEWRACADYSKVVEAWQP